MSRRVLVSLAFSFVCATYFFCAPEGVNAATLYIDPFSVNVLKGDTVTVAVRLDTDEGECVNTVDATLTYSDSIQAVDVSRGKSILTLWVEDPVLNTDERKITFAGGIPNGYCGRISGDPSLTNVVAEIVFRAPGFSVGRPDDIAALVSFAPQTRVLLNDGYGTEAPLKTIEGTINLIQQVGTTTQHAWQDAVRGDTAPPQPFPLELVQNDQVFSGKYYIIFNTTDKQSGVDHYEVIEESRDDLYLFHFGRGNLPWAVAESPYVLHDQTLSSVIRVKAVDKAGNEQIALLVPNDALRRFDPIFLMVGGALALVILLVLSLGLFWYVRRRKRRADAETSQGEHT